MFDRDAQIAVEIDQSKISFLNKDTAKIEFLFFPGGLVEPTAYAPLARSIAMTGYNVHIIKMPFRMSTKGYQNIKTLFDLNSEN